MLDQLAAFTPPNSVIMKKCSKCLEVKTIQEFYRCSAQPDGLNYWCKECFKTTQPSKSKRAKYDSKRYKANKEKLNAQSKAWKNTNKQTVLEYNRFYTAIRTSRVKQATPGWLSKDQKVQMFDFYKWTPVGHHVDHIVPIKGDNVCGLNVPWNLQYLTVKENLSKGNKYDAR